MLPANCATSKRAPNANFLALLTLTTPPLSPVTSRPTLRRSQHGSSSPPITHSVRCVISPRASHGSRRLRCPRTRSACTIYAAHACSCIVGVGPHHHSARTTADSLQWAVMPSRPSYHGDCKQPMPATSPSYGSRDTRALPSMAYHSSRPSRHRTCSGHSLTAHRSALYGNERFKPHAGKATSSRLSLTYS